MRRHVPLAAFLTLSPLFAGTLPAQDLQHPWRSPNRYRCLLEVDPGERSRSNSPTAVDIDFAKQLAAVGASGEFDEHTLEVIAYDRIGSAATFDASRRGYERFLLPWKLEKLYGVQRATLWFVLPNESFRHVAVYFDTAQSARGRPERYPGIVGCGDFFRGTFHRRATGANHFDTFADLDQDGDLDLFRGGVEPFIHCLENVGGGRLVPRGRLTSAGEILTLPHNPGNNRSWVVPHFHDLDRDGDLDFLPSFTDGPHRHRVVWFENTTPVDGPLTFVERRPLETVSSVPIAGGAQRGGWFPGATFVEDFDDDGDGRTDLILGSNNHCYLYRGLGISEKGVPRWAAPVTLNVNGEPIELFNPCFEVADIDADGDWDLLAAPQAGSLLIFENIDRSPDGTPTFATGRPLLGNEVYSERSGHPRITARDFTGDGLVDLVIDRAWELFSPNATSPERDFGKLFANVGSLTRPRWEPRGADEGAFFTEEFQKLDALRQNVVRAVDWNDDGRLDLLAGCCEGCVWLYENTTSQRRPEFTDGRRLHVGGEVLSLHESGRHARPDVCDWNGDGLRDLVVADGAGRVTYFLNTGSNKEPRLAAGRPALVRTASGDLAPIDRGTRSHLMACDWNADGRLDLVFSDEQNAGFYWFRNIAEDDIPIFAPAEGLGLTPYVRPNLGSFVDWDGDGKRDLIACEFEHSIRFYRNIGPARPGTAPRFGNPDGAIILKPFSIMMVSGADAVDFNGDGDLDIITGQGHGDSGLRYYERDFIEDTMRDSAPTVRVQKAEKVGPSLIDVVQGYVDTMLSHGHDRYGPHQSLLFLSALDRRNLRPLTVRPAPPAGIRRGDRVGLPWDKLTGANPQLDQNLMRSLYALSDITGRLGYRGMADAQLVWFFNNTQSPETGLLPWGEHLAWDVFLDRAISSGTELTHEFARPWVLWDETFRLAPKAARAFALGLWNHQIADKKSGAFDRHAPYDRHGPRDGRDFPRHAGFYIQTWAYAYKHTGENEFLRAIRTLLGRFERKRRAPDGDEIATIGPLDTHAAAQLVPEPLAGRLLRFAETEDRLILRNLREQFTNAEGRWEFVPTWQNGYASGVGASWAMFALERFVQTDKPVFREIILAVADSYIDALPDEDVDVWPLAFAQVISAQVAAYRLNKSPVYLEQAVRFARQAVRLYWQDSPLPRASLKTDHYESITGADSLALALLETYTAVNGLTMSLPRNTIDR